jgi:hypothetical protein
MYSSPVSRNSFVKRALPGNLLRIAGHSSGSIYSIDRILYLRFQCAIHPIQNPQPSKMTAQNRPTGKLR